MVYELKVRLKLFHPT